MNSSPIWTDEQLAWFAAEWERAVRGPVRLLTPLPRRVRLRLAIRYVIDGAAIWLAEHGHFRAATLTWRLFGGYQ